MSRSPSERKLPVRFTLIVPMYREATRIGTTIAALATSSLNRPGVELLLVDDGSDDGTADVAREQSARHGVNATVLELPVNRGKGAAVRAGVEAATGGAIAFSDADLSAPIPAIEQCLALVASGGADVVLASRAAAGSVLAVRQPRPRELGGKTFNLALRLLGLTEWRDTQCGLKAFTRDAARSLFADLTIERFAFDVEILQRARRRGLRIVELPIEWRHVETSRVRPMRDGLAMLRDAVRLWWRAFPVEPTATQREAMYAAMARLEARHWWFRTKREMALEAIVRAGARTEAALDVGCGSGTMAATLRSFGFRRVVAIDTRVSAVRDARTRDPALAVSVASAAALPLRAASQDCVVCLDVLEHVADDRAALREFARVLGPGAVLVLTVPAYAWAWSEHDVLLGHRRRYRAAVLLAECARAGLRVERCVYFHSWLVPLALLVRRTPLKRLVGRRPEETSYGNRTLNAALYTVARAERLMTRVVPPPFGLSIMVQARAPESR